MTGAIKDPTHTGTSKGLSQAINRGPIRKSLPKYANVYVTIQSHGLSAGAWTHYVTANGVRNGLPEPLPGVYLCPLSGRLHSVNLSISAHTTPLGELLSLLSGPTLSSSPNSQLLWRHVIKAPVPGRSTPRVAAALAAPTVTCYPLPAVPGASSGAFSTGWLPTY